MRFIRVSLLAVALTSMVVSGTAEAATPSKGTLSKKVKTVRWGGSFTVSQPDSFTGCLGGSTDPICDHFLLKVDLADGARIRIDVPAPDAVSDIDLYVYSPSGSEVGSSANSFGTNEVVQFRHSGRFRNKVYEVRIMPWLVVPGTAYRATAKVK
jgi:hypothetical protein